MNLRTKVIYHVSNKFKDNPFWFADSSIVLQSFICSFARKYNEEIKNNDVISRHHANHPEHDYAPAWKTLEYISFGDLIRLIDNLRQSEIRQEIYGFYGFTDDKSFPNYIEIVRQMRNNCAHGHPLFDIKLYKSLRAGKFKAVLSGDQGDLWSTLKGVLLVIQYFLFYLPGDKGKQFSKDIRKLMNRHRSEDIMEYVAYLNDVPWLENFCGVLPLFFCLNIIISIYLPRQSMCRYLPKYVHILCLLCAHTRRWQFGGLQSLRLYHAFSMALR